MTAMIDTSTWPGSTPMAPLPAPGSKFQLEGEFREATPAGAFAEGLRFLSSCAATVVSQSPGRSTMPDRGVSIDVNGLVSFDGTPLPSPAVMAAPGFEFPDLDFRLTGSAYIRSSEPQHAHLDGSVVSIEGWVNFESGELKVEAHEL